MKKEVDQKIEHSLKLLAKTSLIVLIGVIVSKIFTYLYKLAIARISPATYGLFSLTLVILTVFFTFSSLGLADGLIRYVPLYQGKKNLRKLKYLIRFSSLASASFSLIFGIILFLMAETISIRIFHEPDLIIFLKYLSVTIPLTVMGNLFLSIIRAYQKVSLYSFIVNILSNVLKFALLFILLLMGLKSGALIISYAVSTFIVAVVAYLSCRHLLANLVGADEIESKVKSDVVTNILSYSWPIMLLGIVNSIFFWIDSIVIGYMRDVSNVGFYNSAFTIVALLGISSDLFMQLFLPLIMKEFSKKDYVTIKEVSKQVAKWVYLMNLPLFLLIFIFPGVFINLLFTPEYLVAENALRILAVGGFISTFITICTNLLSMNGRSRTILANIVVASIVNFVLNLILVPKYGIDGAAIATSIVWVLLNVAVFIEVRRSLGFLPLRKKMLRATFVSIVPVASLYFVREIIVINTFSMLILFAISMMLYLVLLVVTGCLDRNDLIIIESAKKKFISKIYLSREKL